MITRINENIFIESIDCCNVNNLPLFLEKVFSKNNLKYIDWPCQDIDPSDSKSFKLLSNYLINLNNSIYADAEIFIIYFKDNSCYDEIGIISTVHNQDCDGELFISLTEEYQNRGIGTIVLQWFVKNNGKKYLYPVYSDNCKSISCVKKIGGQLVNVQIENNRKVLEFIIN